MKKTLFLFLSGFLFLPGCISSKFHSNLNKCNTAQCIQMNYGPPNYIINNGEFGKIWIYTYTTKVKDTNDVNLNNVTNINQETNVYVNSTNYNNNSDDILMKIYINNDNNVYKTSHARARYNFWAISFLVFGGLISLPFVLFQ